MLNILCGPYVGDFEHEILTFLPHVKWIGAHIKYDNLIVSTHQNRQFLYNDIPNIKFQPINEELSISENRQIGLLNSNLTKKEYIDYCKTIKDKAAQTFNIKKSTITQYPIIYSQAPAQYSAYQKLYSKIPNTSKDIRKKIDNEILFIPDISESEARNLQLYNMLRKNFSVVIAGDSKTHLKDKNIILKRPNYFTDVYRCIIKWLDECQIVFCPASHWTFLAKQQNALVYSWGNIAQYKGENTLLMPSCNETKIEKIYDQFMWHMNRRTNA